MDLVGLCDYGCLYFERNSKISPYSPNCHSLSALVSLNETKYSSFHFHSFWTLSLFLIRLTSCQATSTVVLHIQQHLKKKKKVSSCC